MEGELADAKDELEQVKYDKTQAEKAKKQAEQKLADLQAEIDEIADSNKALQEDIKKKKAQASTESSGGDIGQLADLQAKWGGQTKKLVKELEEVREDLAEAQKLNRGYEKDFAVAGGALRKEYGSKKEARVTKAKKGLDKSAREKLIKDCKKEADLSKKRKGELEQELKDLKKELDALKDIMTL